MVRQVTENGNDPCTFLPLGYIIYIKGIGVWNGCYAELASQKLLEYKSIGRYIRDRQLFISRLGPAMNNTSGASYPSDIVRSFGDYVFR
jgi:hypothetical protein